MLAWGRALVEAGREGECPRTSWEPLVRTALDTGLPCAEASGVAVPLMDGAGAVCAVAEDPIDPQLLVDVAALVDVQLGTRRREAQFVIAERLAGFAAWDLEITTGATTWSLTDVHPDDRAHLDEVIAEAIETGGEIDVEYRMVSEHGDERLMHARGTRGYGRVLGVTQDITETRRSEWRLRHLAEHDPLTGLANRRRFTQELEREIALAARHGNGGAVLLMDLDGFKDVNDTLGHAAGDELLCNVAAALERRLRTTDILARLGGDEFAALLPQTSRGDAERLAVDLVAIVAEHGAVKGEAGIRGVTASIGVAALPSDGSGGADRVLLDADVAMYRAKTSGGNRVQAFDGGMRAERAVRRRTEDDLRAALLRDELTVVYQPIIDQASARLVSAEALVRWRHPTRGLLMPGDFIEVAEESGLIAMLGSYVLRRAATQARKWRAAGYEIGVNVNVSPRQLAEPGFAHEVRRILMATALPPSALTLEITESTVIERLATAAERLEPLRALGVRVAIDDFGVGASSLTYLRSLPIDTIKIDRAFVAGLPDGPQDRAIIAAIVSLAGEMGMGVVAEGVETQAQHEELISLGCRLGQGFLYARPISAEDLDVATFDAGIAPIRLEDVPARRVTAGA